MLFIIGDTEIKFSEEMTQGDLRALKTYAISIIRMIQTIVETISHIPNHKTSLVAYANVLRAAGRISELNVCW